MGPRWITRLLTPVLAAGALSITVAYAPASGAASRCPGIAIAAHRGSPDRGHTENTIRATKRAIALRADMLEGDMALTSDGVWVMMHDRTVDRTTNGRGMLRDKTLAQVRRLRTNDGVSGGVPTVEAQLSVLDSRPSMGMQLEIKPSVVGPAALDRLFTSFAAHGLQQRLTVTSFNAKVIAAVRQRFPGWQTALVTNRRVPASTAKKYGDTLVVNQKVLTSVYASSIRRAGLAISVFTTRSTSQLSRARSLRVSSVITDDVGTARKFCG